MVQITHSNHRLLGKANSKTTLAAEISNKHRPIATVLLDYHTGADPELSIVFWTMENPPRFTPACCTHQSGRKLMILVHVI